MTTELIKLLPKSTVTKFSDIRFTTSLIQYKKDGKEKDLQVVLSKIILDIFNFYNEAISDEQVILIANQIIEKGYYTNLSDLQLFKNMAIAGDFKNRTEWKDGERFNIKYFRLSPDVLIDWFNYYLYMRGENLAIISEKTHTKQKNQPFTKKGLDKLQEILQKLTDKKKEVQLKEEKTTINKSFLSLENHILQEFEANKIVNEREQEYIVFKNKNLTRSEYLRTRFEEVVGKWAKDYCTEEPYQDYIQNNIKKFITKKP